MKLILAFGVAVALCAQTPAVVDNDSVRILKVTQDPHKKTRLHDHKVNRVMIYLNEGKQTIDYQGVGKKNMHWKPGQALWSPASGMHIAEITSDKPVTIVEVELKKPGPGTKITAPLDPVKIDPKHYKVEMENDQVRVIRFKNEPHGKIALHEHSLNRAVVFLTETHMKVTAPDGKVTALDRQAGEVAWSGPAKHSEENASDKPVELLVVEVK